MKEISTQNENILNVDIFLDNIVISARNENELNFDSDERELSINISGIELNFELRDYDKATRIYRILLDFIESLSVGDVF